MKFCTIVIGDAIYVANSNRQNYNHVTTLLALQLVEYTLFEQHDIYCRTIALSRAEILGIQFNLPLSYFAKV